MHFSIRTAKQADSEEVARVYLRSRKRFLPFAPLAHDDEEVTRWISQTLIPSGCVLVVETKSGIVGMMASSRKNDISWIDHLYLHPNLVGKGIGSAMLDLAKAELPPPIRLYTFQANAGARRFYERHGFVPISLSDGSDNEELCPDILYEYAAACTETPEAEQVDAGKPDLTSS